MDTQASTRYSLAALQASPTRTFLILLAMSIGVASVMLLTSLGDSARRYVVDRFSSLGTHLLIVLPGRSETMGALPPMFGETPRDLTIDDAMALYRSHAVDYVAPIIAGSAPVSYRQLEREVTIVGSTAELYPVRKLALEQGQFLPPGDPRRSSAVCVLGKKVKEALFGQQNPLGQWVRINDWRFRVIGVLKADGPSLGDDLKDMVIIPVSSAQSIFDSESLFRIMIQAKSRELIPAVKQHIIDTIRERHDGEDDVTVIQQDALLTTFDRIFKALTVAVASIAGISLVVAGVLIMNVMLVAVSQRTHEIGLLKAIGANRACIVNLFLIEATLVAIAGAVLGLLLAYACIVGLNAKYPQFPIFIPYWSLPIALGVAIATGIIFGWLPARRAAKLDPVIALAKT